MICILKRQLYKPKFLRRHFEEKEASKTEGKLSKHLKNQKKDQIATKVEIKGDYKDPKTNTLDAIWEVLLNAFVQALVPSIDHEISLKSVDTEIKGDDRNLLQRIFSTEKKKDK